MSFIRTHQRKLAGLAVAGGAVYFFNPFRTPAVANIEKRYTIGGASPTHTPATSTKRGDPDQVVGSHEQHKGVGTPHFEERHSGQKPDPSFFDKKWNQTNYGAEKGK